MPDTLPRIEVIKATGFVVVTSFQDPTSVIPPRRESYSYEHFVTLNDAADAYAEYERGEHRGFTPVGIFPARHGMPVATSLGALDLQRLMRETEAA